MTAAALAAVFLVSSPRARAQGVAPAAAKPNNGNGKIGVAPLGAPGLSAELRLKMEDAAAAGLRASGAEVISSAELSRARSTASLGACTDGACEQKLAQLTDTRYWLRGTVALDTSTYRIHLELTEARSGSVVSGRDDTCDICTEAEAIEAVNMAASTLKAAAKANLTVAPGVVTAPAGGTSKAAAPSASNGATEGTTPTPVPDLGTGTGGADQADVSHRPTWLRVLPWVAFAGAAGALAYGAYFWSIDGDSKPCPAGKSCVSNTVTAGPEKYTFTSVGVVLAAAGVVLLLVPDPAPAATSTATSDSRARLRSAAAPAAPSLSLGLWGRGLSLSGQF